MIDWILNQLDYAFLIFSLAMGSLPFIYYFRRFIVKKWEILEAIMFILASMVSGWFIIEAITLILEK